MHANFGLFSSAITLRRCLKAPALAPGRCHRQLHRGIGPRRAGAPCGPPADPERSGVDWRSDVTPEIRTSSAPTPTGGWDQPNLRPCSTVASCPRPTHGHRRPPSAPVRAAPHWAVHPRQLPDDRRERAAPSPTRSPPTRPCPPPRAPTCAFRPARARRPAHARRHDRRGDAGRRRSRPGRGNPPTGKPPCRGLAPGGHFFGVYVGAPSLDSLGVDDVVGGVVVGFAESVRIVGRQRFGAFADVVEAGVGGSPGGFGIGVDHALFSHRDGPIQGRPGVWLRARRLCWLFVWSRGYCRFDGLDREAIPTSNAGRTGSTGETASRHSAPRLVVVCASVHTSVGLSVGSPPGLSVGSPPGLLVGSPSGLGLSVGSPPGLGLSVGSPPAPWSLSVRQSGSPSTMPQEPRRDRGLRAKLALSATSKRPSAAWLLGPPGGYVGTSDNVRSDVTLFVIPPNRAAPSPSPAPPGRRQRRPAGRRLSPPALLV